MTPETLRLISARSTSRGVILGQRKEEAERSQDTALLNLLPYLSLAGAVVGLHATECHSDAVEQLVARKADYVLAVKSPQQRLYAGLVEQFARVEQRNVRDVPLSYVETTDEKPGLTDIRRCWVLSYPRGLESPARLASWRKLAGIVMVERERRSSAQVQLGRTYFLSSLPADARQLLETVRSYWAIDREFEWALDIDYSREPLRLRGAGSFVPFQQAALRLLQRHPAKGSLRSKQFKAALDESFLLELLSKR